MKGSTKAALLLAFSLCLPISSLILMFDIWFFDMVIICYWQNLTLYISTGFQLCSQFQGGRRQGCRWCSIGYTIFSGFVLYAIQTSGHPVIWTSGHLVFWPSSHLIIRPSGHPAIWSSDHPVIWSSRLLAIIRSSDHPVFWSSGLLSQCLKNVRIGIFLAYLIVGYTSWATPISNS